MAWCRLGWPCRRSNDVDSRCIIIIVDRLPTPPVGPLKDRGHALLSPTYSKTSLSTDIVCLSLSFSAPYFYIVLTGILLDLCEHAHDAASSLSLCVSCCSCFAARYNPSRHHQTRSTNTKLHDLANTVHDACSEGGEDADLEHGKQAIRQPLANAMPLLHGPKPQREGLTCTTRFSAG
jgi:hypothetical protein